MLVDTHCHLGDSAFDSDRNAVVARAREAGVGHIVIVADSIPATGHAIELATDFNCSATAGVHPHQASSWTDDARARIVDALDDPAVVAVGETGLDYHYDYSPRDIQRRAFEAQLELAERHGRPVVIHSREADDDMAAMLRATTGRVRLVLHSFSSGAAVFEAGLEVGAWFGFSGMVTFRNWKQADQLTGCPPDRLLIETDAPYLAPVPHRGKRNEPAFVSHVAEAVAAATGHSTAWVSETTTRNATELFRLNLPRRAPERTSRE